MSAARATVAPAFSYASRLRPPLPRIATAPPCFARAAFSVRATATPHSPVIR
jgi:hypothetical protein